MSIGKTYKEAFQKAIRSLEIGRYGLGYAKDFHEKTKEQLLKLLITPSSERHFICMKRCARERPLTRSTSGQR